MQTGQAPLKPQNRTFSEEFKKAKIKELDEKLVSIQELVTSYKVSRTSIYKWLIKYSIHYRSGEPSKGDKNGDRIRKRSL